MTIKTTDYDIIIERGALRKTGTLTASAVGLCRAIIISDDQVYPLYGEAVSSSLTEAGLTLAEPFIFPHGEEQKNLTTISAMLEHMAEERLQRRDVVIALGGGVTGDMAGFASAVYLRGIRFVQIPTSLLSMSDSSVGGKTGVDLSRGKNLAGAFHKPSLVVIDPDCLATLPRDYYTDGMAECIKMGMISDTELFSLCEEDGDIVKIIQHSVSRKAEIVERDFTEQGERKKLNFGHTPGHGIELLSGYRIPHGHAVAAGMVMMTRAAVKRGLCSADVLTRLEKTVAKQVDAEAIIGRFSPRDIAVAALNDKKASGKSITLIVPRGIGICDLTDVPTESLGEWFEDGAR